MNNGDLGNTKCGHLSLSKVSATTFYNVQEHYHIVEYATKMFLVWEHLRIQASGPVGHSTMMNEYISLVWKCCTP